jgi:hypothetical protein
MAPHRVDNSVVVHTHCSSSRYAEILERAINIIEDDWRTDSDNDEFFDDTDDMEEADSLPLLQQQQQQQQQQHQSTSTLVQFAVTIKHHEVMSRYEYTSAELKNCWFTLEEKQKMNASKDKVVVRMEKGKPAKGNHPYRGLECLTQTGSDALDLNISKVVDAVMDEQEAQWKAGQVHPNNDLDRLAAISQAMTGHSQLEAYELAAEDERDARLAWDLPEEESSQHSLWDDASVASMKLPAAAPVKKTKKTRRRKKATERKTANSKTCCGDPPGKIQRTLSHNASDILMKMRLASHDAMASHDDAKVVEESIHRSSIHKNNVQTTLRTMLRRGSSRVCGSQSGSVN